MEYNEMNVSSLYAFVHSSAAKHRNYTLKAPKSCHAIAIMLSGSGELKSGEKSVSLNCGDAFYIAKGTRYYSEWTPDKSGTVSFCAVHFDFCAPPKIFATNAGTMLVIAENDRVHELIQAIKNEIAAANENAFKTLSLFFELLSIAMPSVERGMGARYGEKIAPAVEFICKNLDKNASADELAALCGLSRARFFVAFKSATGLTPLVYTTKLKLKAAEKALLTQDCSVERLAERLGYLSPVYLIRQFKKEYGTTPFQYKKAHRVIAEGL